MKRLGEFQSSPEVTKGGSGDDEKWVSDSSVDYKGRVPLRASTGAWKASLFIIGGWSVPVNTEPTPGTITTSIELGERLSFFGIATSLIIYLTKVLHQELKTAARSVNYWAGITTLMALLGGFVADAYFGRYTTVLLSSLLYISGLILLSMSALVPSLKACGSNDQVCDEASKTHEIIFFLAIYMISIGTGGHKPSLESFGADQFDDDHSEERKKKMSYFNWWNFGLCSGLLFGVTVIVYIQDHIGWGAADLILTAVMAVSVVIFIAGRPFYRYRQPLGSPLTPLLQVIVAAIRKRKLPYPSDPSLLHEFPKTANNGHGRFLYHTDKLKFLDKAAIYEDNGDLEEKQRSYCWRLATVTKVEEMKLILNMIPIWLVTLPFGVTVAQTSTFFIKQAANLNREVGNGSFILPATAIFCLAAVGMIVSITIYDKLLVPMCRRSTGNERGINILQRIGIGMIFVIAAMIIAALVENKRLQVVAKNPKTGSLTMSVFWLAPQFLIVGFGDGFTIVGLQEYFYDQVPDSMRSLGIAFYLSVIGVGSFLSSLLITVVDEITGCTGKSWFGKDLNRSRLDKFYWLLAAMSTANLCIYVLIARRYSYKNVQQRVAVADCYEDEARQNEESMA